MEELIKFMDQWQTLFGAFVGGVFALCVALLVAYKARRQEDLSAGMVLVGNLVSIRAAHKSLMEVAKEEGVSDNDIGPWLAEKLVWSRPKLSPSFRVLCCSDNAIGRRNGGSFGFISYYIFRG